MFTKNHSITRRDALALAAASVVACPTAGYARDDDGPQAVPDDLSTANKTKNETDAQRGEFMRVHYLEMVTTDVDKACELYAAIHGVSFGDADPSLGGARTAAMTDGAIMGIRAPMHAAERTVTRAYMLVENIEAAVAAAKKSGAEIAVPPMKIPGHGTCAVYFQGGIEAGLWQL